METLTHVVKNAVKAVSTTVSAVAMTAVLQGCTYNYSPSTVTTPAQMTQPSNATNPIAQDPVMGSAGATASGPSMPKAAASGAPSYPNQEAQQPGAAANRGMQGPLFPAGQPPAEQAAFGANFWAYMLATVVIRCVPDCFR